MRQAATGESMPPDIRHATRPLTPIGNPPTPRRTGIELDPLVGMGDATKPLRSRLLAVPGLRARYLEHVRTLAAESLNWKALGPVVAQYRAVIEQEVKADTRKLTSYEAFQRASADEVPAVAAAAPAAPAPAPGQPGPQQGRPRMGLREFADLRSQFLLEYQEKRVHTGEQDSAPSAAGASKESSQ